MSSMIARKRITRLLITALLLLVATPGVSVLGDQGEQGAQIRLQYASFDPLVGEPASVAGQALRVSPGGASMALVQFTGPVLAEWKDTVQAGGVRLYDYIPEHAFIARLDAQSAAWLRSLPFVRWVGDYYPAYRMPAALSQADPADQTPLEVDILALPDADLAALGAQVEALGGSVQSQSASEFSSYLRLSIPAGQAGSLAALDEVVWVQLRAEMGLFNDVGGDIMYVSNLRTKTGLYGSGQVVAVADTGLDLGTTAAAMSDDFEGRIVAGQAICARGTWNDLHGHGTHVAGSVLGNGVLSGSNPVLHQYGDSFSGVAPEARVYFQAIADSNDSLCIPLNLKDELFKPAYDSGARIHSNSWGSTVGHSEYDNQAAQVDQAAWSYKNLLIVFAAGNHGIDVNGDGLVDYGSMASPGTAKNALAVGATENDRPSFTDFTYGGVWSAYFPAEPINSDTLADDTEGMAAFSSRGPTDDGRIKPDIVAPGTFILSTRSHEDGTITGWGEYDDDYIYNGGTSMATPLTAGGAALVREWLTEARGLSNPSAALMKAVLLNGAADISPGQYPDPYREIPAQRPNNVSGWGRADLQSSLSPASPRQVWLVDNTSGLSTNGKSTYTLKVGNTQALSGESSNFDLSAESSPAEEASTQLEAAPPAEGLASAQTTPEPPSPAAPAQEARQVELAEHNASSKTASQLTSPAIPAADVNLELDDGSFEDSLGLVDDPVTPTTSYQFLWLNRFTPDPGVFPFNLEQIQVLFDGSADVPLGGAIDLAVYQDADGNPANGATLLGTIHETVKAVDGTTWSEYNLATPIEISGPGDVLIAVINRYNVDDISPPSYPASIDQTANQLRSWIGWWEAEPPDPPLLHGYDTLTLVGNLTTGGNWMIRGYGSSASAPTPTPSPTPGPSPTPSPTPVTGGPLRISLVWTDYPGVPAAADVLVNDLDLEVVAPGGVHYYGNYGLYTAGHCLRQVSSTVKWDACNNAEGVYIPNAPYGTYTVYVHGYEVPNGPQPFAVVASGDYLLSGGLNQKVYLPLMRKLK